MLDVQALAERVMRLTASLDGWNKAMLWGLIAASVIAGYVGVTTRFTIVRAKQLSVAQGELDAAKEAEANRGIATLRVRAANAERSLLELQQRIADRHLTPGQKNRLYKNLSVTPTGLVFVSAPSNDGEASIFAKEIEGVLRQAGWSNEPAGGVVWEGTEPTGVLLVVKSKEDMLPQVNRLRQAFSAASIPLVLTVEPRSEAGKIYLVVGHRPEK